MEDIGRREFGGQALTDKFRFQIPFVCLVSFIAQWAIGEFVFNAMFITPSTYHSYFADFFATAAGLFMFRQMRAFPGARGLAYLLPSLLGSYGLVVFLLFVLRLPYSSVLLFTGFVATVTTSWALSAFTRRSNAYPFYVVPSDGTRALMREAPTLDWIVMNSPELPGAGRYTIIADLRSDMSSGWERLLAKAAISGSPVYHYKQVRESLTGRVQIEHLSENNFGSLIPNHVYVFLKRVMDVVGAALLLVVLSIPMLIVALLIRLDSSGPALFRQQRMGFRGQPFTMLKFRTMTVRQHPQSEAAARQLAITRDDDQRVTRIGRFLRRTRIDELPQLVNVLTGEMSLIGPRPEAMALSSWYEQELDFYSYRHIVRPGLTGWAQVNQGHVAELDDVLVKLHYDFYYIKNFSAWLDILIAIRTIGIVFSGNGAK